MDYEEKLQVLWAICFIVSGVIFAMAFWLTPIIGLLAALGYIILYIGLSLSFLIVFSGMKKINMHLASALDRRREEVQEIQKELKNKYLRKKIDEEAYKRLVERYESELTELDVKLKEIKKPSRRRGLIRRKA